MFIHMVVFNVHSYGGVQCNNVHTCGGVQYSLADQVLKFLLYGKTMVNSLGLSLDKLHAYLLFYLYLLP